MKNTNLINRALIMEDLQTILAQEISGNAMSSVGTGLEIAMARISKAPEVKIDGDTSDGYHTFNELYHHRAVLFSVIVNLFPNLSWKSKKHHDGTMFEGMFIVGMNLPGGQATYHYDIDPYWDMFQCSELESAPEWDGHTPDGAISRIAGFGNFTAYFLNSEMEAKPHDP